MREEGILAQEVDERSTLADVTDAFTVPNTGGYWGDYTAKLDEVPHPDYGVNISGYTEVYSLPVSADEFYVNYRKGTVTFHSSDAGNSVTATYKGRGTIISAPSFNLMQTVENITFTWVGAMEVTDDTNFAMVFPVGATEHESAFGTPDLGYIEVQGVSIQAQVYDSGWLSGNTTIRISNKVKAASGADTLDVSLTNTSADTDRRNSAQGSVLIDTSSQALYVIGVASGGHQHITITIWFRREAP